MEREIGEVLVLALKFLPEAVLLVKIETGLESVVFANHAFERLSGYSLEELMDRGLTLLQGPETEIPALQRLLRPLSVSAMPQLDVLLYKKNGTPFWDRIKTSQVQTGNGSFQVQIHSDITRNREIEKRFVLAQKREATSHLVSGLAHDFNNLLTAILVYSGLMAAKTKNDPQLQRYANEVHNSAERGGQLVAQLLNLGRDETGGPEVLDLRDLVEQNSDLLKRVLGEEVRLDVQAALDLKKIKAHPGRIQQILLNLAINARHAMPAGGDFVVRLANEGAMVPVKEPASASGSYVLLLVRDTGTGMDRGTLMNIFKPFFSTKGRENGTGLGLFAVRTIVEQYEGSIDVESERGKGTTFKILLPAI